MQYTKTNLINIRQYLKNRRKNCCNMIDDCNVTMVTSISPQHYQKETKQYIYVLYMCPLIKNNNIFSIFEILLYANNKLDLDNY
jgi:hypothetical protein